MLQRTISERNQSDQNNLEQHSQEIFAPDLGALRVDVTGIVHDHQFADDLILLVRSCW